MSPKSTMDQTQLNKNIDYSRGDLARSGARKQPTKVALPITVGLVLMGVIAFGAVPRIFQNQALINHTQTLMAQPTSVATVVAQAGSATQVFQLPGTTQAIQDANIYARVDGYIHKRYVDIGDHVHAGQVLADIDTPELDQQVQAAISSLEQAGANVDNANDALNKAQSDLRTAIANVHKAKTDLQYYTVEVGRYKLLSQEGAVSLESRDSEIQTYNAGVATLEALVAAQKSAEAAVRSATAGIHVATAAFSAAQAQRDQIEATRSFKKVTALFDGIIIQRNVDAGALVTSGSSSNNTVLFELARTDVLRIFVYVPEQYIPDVYQGEQALLGFEEYPDKDFTGTVSHVAGGVDPNSKTLQVEIHVPNPDHKLMPGMYAQVRFQCKSPTRLAIVPATTLQTKNDGSYMYTVDSTNHVHMHKVEIGRDLGGQFEISKGISAGETVIVHPQDDLEDGMFVTPVMTQVDNSSKNGTK